MYFSRDIISSLDSLFHIIRLRNYSSAISNDDRIKYEQILAYLEVIDSEVNKLSSKKKLIFVESAAGNCYLSFLLYYFYTNMCYRPIEVHCIDSNEKLMNNCRVIAETLSLMDMNFHAMDINDFCIETDIDFAYSLHACDTATDKALYLGIRKNARCIHSVCCCQETATKRFKSTTLKGIARYKALKEKLVYIVVDAMRAQLLGNRGYHVDIFEFISTRITNKNIMLRARKDNNKREQNIEDDYVRLKDGFSIEPELAHYLSISSLT